MSKLSKDTIVTAAIEILDTEGENALTFRALSAHLKTGAGAIYWHVADKDAVLSAATDALIETTLRTAPATVQAVALAIFDAVETRPWLGTQLSREPWQPAAGRIFEAVGSALPPLPETQAFHAASALMSLILGAAGQQSAARRLPSSTHRPAFLATVAQNWSTGPFTHRIAAQLRDHDDRAQFLAGIELVLKGLA